jgi:hypothetical protein
MTSLRWLRAVRRVVVTPDNVSRPAAAATLCFARTLGHCVCCGTHTRGSRRLLAIDTLFLVTSDAGERERVLGPDC